MSWIEQIKEGLPEYAKDTRLNIDAVMNRSTLDKNVAEGCALAAVFATGNTKLWTWIHSVMEDKTEAQAALVAGVTMSQNNIWYPYVEMADDPNLSGLPAGLRMNAIMSHGGTTKARFEAYSLAASIVGKCEFCISAHYKGLKSMGYTVEQLRDIGRIAAVMTSVSRIMAS